MNVKYEYFSTVTTDFEDLSNEFNREFMEKFGKAQEKYQKYNLLDNIKDVIICYIDDKPIGCVSIRFYYNDVYELKRMFIKSKYRGLGISKIMLAMIENRAKEKGINKIILETGAHLEQAVQLYKKSGYQKIVNYGDYANIPESICMEKILL